MEYKVIDILEKHYYGRNRIEQECAKDLVELLEDDWYGKLKALMEGLEIENIELFLAAGKRGDYNNLGKLMQKRIKEIKDSNECKTTN